MAKKIVTHMPPRHMDDFCGISLLLTIYNNTEIEYVHPQEVPKEYIENEEIILVDVGGVYDEYKNNYDHHQNRDLNCSLVLILKHYFPEIGSSPALEAIDVIDRFGVQEAVKRNLVKIDKEVDRLRKIILLVKPSIEVGFAVKNLLNFAAEAKLEHNDFIKMLYEVLRVQGLTKEAEEKILEEENQFKEKLNKIKYVEINGFKIAISMDDTLAPFHSDFFALTRSDILIERNAMNPKHTSVIVNTNNSNKENAIQYADELVSGYNVIFRHKTGFIRVVDIEVENFVEELLKSKLNKK